MTVDDGATLDSRQALDGDRLSEVTLRSLAMSMLWWRTAASVVMPVLEGVGPEAFAMVVGNRSVVELRQDGTTYKTGLRSLLPGGTTTVEIIRTGMKQPLPEGYEEAEVLRNWDEQDMGTVGFKRGESGRRWRFLNGNEYYLSHAGRKIGPAVIVDTTPWVIFDEHFAAARFKALERSRLFTEGIVLILPHTSGADVFFQRYVDWVRAGRPPDPPGSETMANEVWSADAIPDPIHYTAPVPTRADFAVTGLVENTEWHDPSDLEAARSLLEARYDLKIGIWDLASNPTLRETLLDVVPVAPAPAEVARAPAAAVSRAEARVEAKMSERAAEKKALAAIVTRLAPLQELGWEPRTNGERWPLRLPLTEAFTRWREDQPFPLVQLELSVMKRRTAVSAFSIMYNQVNLNAYVEARRGTLERIASPEPCPLGKYRPVLWRAKGGWADRVDWDERVGVFVARTPHWVNVFAELCDECRRIRRESGY
jgi:hypothetical protein